MKRLIQIMVFSVFFCCLSLVFINTAQAADMTVTESGVNFRSDASLDSDVIYALDAGTRVEVISHDPAGWSKVQVNGTVGYIRSDFLAIPSGSGSVAFKTTSKVNVRNGPSIDSDIITTLDPGSSVEMVEHNPAGWSKVMVSGVVGYIRSDLVVLPTQSAQQSSAGQSSATQQSAPQQSSSASSSQSSQNLITTEGVNFRAAPSLDAGIISTIYANTSVEVLEQDSNGWSKAMVDGKVGYIKSEFLSIDGSRVELLEWSSVMSIMKYGVPLKVLDVRTGLVYYVQCFSKGDHADVEPVTKADTDMILQIRNGVWSWAARPVWVTIEGRVIAGSIVGMPHDVSTISGNGMNGHICLHFYGSTTSSSSASYKADLRNAVMEAWNAR